MGFFKPSPGAASGKAIARLQALIWILIYAGLLTVVLGLFVSRQDEDTGNYLLTGGGLMAAAGFALIYLRSRINTDS